MTIRERIEHELERELAAMRQADPKRQEIEAALRDVRAGVLSGRLLEIVRSLQARRV